MALLETMTADEAIKHGVTVYPHVAEPQAQPLDLSPWTLSPWAKWVAADADGYVDEYECKPHTDREMWAYGGRCKIVGRIDMTGIDWRQTLTPVNQADTIEAARCILSGLTGGESSEVVQRRLWGYEDDAQPWCEQCNLPLDICRGHDDGAQSSDWMQAHIAAEVAAIDEHEAFAFAANAAVSLDNIVLKPSTIDVAHHHTYPLIHCECGMAFVLLGCVADTVFEQGTPPFCPYCGKGLTPPPQVAIHADAIPADVASALLAHHSAAWCERLCDELAKLLPSVLVWQLSTLDGDALVNAARQLAYTDSAKANMIAEALWSEAMDAENARMDTAFQSAVTVGQPITARVTATVVRPEFSVDYDADECDTMPAMAGSVT
jgi:hypothetical protein